MEQNKKICQTYVDKGCRGWSHAELIDFLTRLAFIPDPNRSSESLCEELDNLCNLAGITEETVKFDDMLTSLSVDEMIEQLDENLQPYLKQMALARTKDRERLKKYCKLLDTLQSKGIAIDPKLIAEIGQFITKVVKRYQINPDKLRRGLSPLALNLNCEYLKRKLT